MSDDFKINIGFDVDGDSLETQVNKAIDGVEDKKIDITLNLKNSQNSQNNINKELNDIKKDSDLAAKSFKNLSRTISNSKGFKVSSSSLRVSGDNTLKDITKRTKDIKEAYNRLKNTISQGELQSHLGSNSKNTVNNNNIDKQIRQVEKETQQLKKLSEANKKKNDALDNANKSNNTNNSNNKNSNTNSNDVKQDIISLKERYKSNEEKEKWQDKVNDQEKTLASKILKTTKTSNLNTLDSSEKITFKVNDFSNATGIKNSPIVSVTQDYEKYAKELSSTLIKIAQEETKLKQKIAKLSNEDSIGNGEHITRLQTELNSLKDQAKNIKDIANSLTTKDNDFIGLVNDKSLSKLDEISKKANNSINEINSNHIKKMEKDLQNFENTLGTVDRKYANFLKKDSNYLDTNEINQVKNKYNDFLSLLDEVRSKGNNNNLQVVDINNIKQAKKELENFINDYKLINNTNKIGQNNEKSSTNSINTTKNNVNALKEKIESLQFSIKNLSNYDYVDASKLNEAKSSFESLISKYKEYGNLISSGKTKNINLQELKEYTQQANSLSRILKEIKSEGTSKKGFAFDKLDVKKLLSDITQLRQEGKITAEQFENLARQLKNLDDSSGTVKFKENLKSIKQEIKNATNETKNLKKAFGQEFFGDLYSNLRSFQLGELIGDSIRNALFQVKDIVISMDDAMREVRKVANPIDIDSAFKIDEIKNKAEEVSKSLGITSTDFIEALSTTIKLGFSDIQEATEIARQTMMFANVADMSPDAAAEASAALINAWNLDTVKQYKKEVDGVVKSYTEYGEAIDLINHLANTKPIDGVGLMEALKDTSNVAKQFGIDMKELSSLVVAANSTIQDPNKVGTGLRTLMLRMSGADYDLKEEDLAYDRIGKKVKGLSGVDIFEKDGKSLKSMTNLIDELHKKWNTFDDATQKTLAKTIGGARQSETFLAIMNSYDMYKETLADLKKGGHLGSAEQENLQFIDSISGKLATLKTTWGQVVTNIFSSETVKGFLDVLIKILDTVVDITNSLKDFNLALPAAFAGAVGVKSLFGFLAQFGFNFRMGMFANAFKGVDGEIGKIANSIDKTKRSGNSFLSSFTRGLNLLNPVLIATTALIGVSLYKGLKNANDKTMEKLSSEISTREDNIKTIKQEKTQIEKLTTRYKELSKIPKKNLTQNNITEKETILQELSVINEELVIRDVSGKITGINFYNLSESLKNLEKELAREELFLELDLKAKVRLAELDLGGENNATNIIEWIKNELNKTVPEEVELNNLKLKAKLDGLDLDFIESFVDVNLDKLNLPDKMKEKYSKFMTKMLKSNIFFKGGDLIARFLTTGSLKSPTKESSFNGQIANIVENGIKDKKEIDKFIKLQNQRVELLNKSLEAQFETNEKFTENTNVLKNDLQDRFNKDSWFSKDASKSTKDTINEIISLMDNLGSVNSTQQRKTIFDTLLDGAKNNKNEMENFLISLKTIREEFQNTNDIDTYNKSLSSLLGTFASDLGLDIDNLANEKKLKNLFDSLTIPTTELEISNTQEILEKATKELEKYSVPFSLPNKDGTLEIGAVEYFIDEKGLEEIPQKTREIASEVKRIMNEEGREVTTFEESSRILSSYLDGVSGKFANLEKSLNSLDTDNLGIIDNLMIDLKFRSDNSQDITSQKQELIKYIANLTGEDVEVVTKYVDLRLENKNSFEHTTYEFSKQIQKYLSNPKIGIDEEELEYFTKLLVKISNSEDVPTDIKSEIDSILNSEEGLTNDSLKDISQKIFVNSKLIHKWSNGDIEKSDALVEAEKMMVNFKNDVSKALKEHTGVESEELEYFTDLLIKISNQEDIPPNLKNEIDSILKQGLTEEKLIEITSKMDVALESLSTDSIYDELNIALKAKEIIHPKVIEVSAKVKEIKNNTAKELFDYDTELGNDSNGVFQASLYEKNLKEKKKLLEKYRDDYNKNDETYKYYQSEINKIDSVLGSNTLKEQVKVETNKLNEAAEFASELKNNIDEGSLSQEEMNQKFEQFATHMAETGLDSNNIKSKIEETKNEIKTLEEQKVNLGEGVNTEKIDKQINDLKENLTNFENFEIILSYTTKGEVANNSIKLPEKLTQIVDIGFDIASSNIGGLYEKIKGTIEKIKSKLPKTKLEFAIDIANKVIGVPIKPIVDVVAKNQAQTILDNIKQRVIPLLNVDTSSAKTTISNLISTWDTWSPAQKALTVVKTTINKVIDFFGGKNKEDTSHPPGPTSITSSPIETQTSASFSTETQASTRTQASDSIPSPPTTSTEGVSTGISSRASKSSSNKWTTPVRVQNSSVNYLIYGIDLATEITNKIEGLTNQLNLLDAKMEHVFGKKKINYMKEQIKLLEKQKTLHKDYQKQLQSEQKKLKTFLSGKGFKFDSDGGVTNYVAKLMEMNKKLDGIKNEKQYEKYEKDLEEIKNALDRYLDITFSELPDAVTEWEDLENQIKDVYKEQLDIAKETEDKLMEIYEKQIEEHKDMLEEQTENTIKAIEKRVKAEIDAIDELKEAYNEARREEDYQEELSKKREELFKIEKQIALASRDNSTTGKAKLDKLMEEYEKLKDDLDDFIQDRQDDLVNDLFDDEKDRLEKESDKEIERLEKELEDALKKLEDTYTEEKLMEMIKEAISSGKFTGIDGTVTNLNEVMLQFLNSTSDGLGATGQIIKNEWIGNLEIAKDVLKDIDKIVKELDLNKFHNNNSLFAPKAASIPVAQSRVITPQDMSIESLINDLNSNNANIINFNQPIVKIEGNVTEDVMPQLENMAKEIEKRIANNIVYAIR